ncbi:septum formation initiator family protein [Edaphobacillus lindanitolerans]|uniref:Cell division protein DivIC n=1 Tax=Edaphobacillus lindanitolerans TaxID=550447 RepID=A0A1U7PRF9_9BACI|nr:septum formation initiator family protein [Edaphobacillus lindanitolerans]SIT93346.1 cell division protein DivIC [Edaphobacillus lindanitolerans]
MEQRNRQSKPARRPVTPIQTDYVRAKERKEQIRQARKTRLYRRLAVFGLIVLLTFGWMTWSIVEKNKVLAAKQQEKEAALAELEKLEEEGHDLKLQLEKLDDPEYIAKLARKEYLLSEEGEIIFTLPDDKDKKKDDGSKEDKKEKGGEDYDSGK